MLGLHVEQITDIVPQIGGFPLSKLYSNGIGKQRLEYTSESSCWTVENVLFVQGKVGGNPVFGLVSRGLLE